MTAQPDSTDATATATRVWAAMQEFVTGHDRRRAIRSALDLGPIKVELLIGLIDGPMTLREIARAIAVDPPGATVAVDLLEARGLVRRAPHPDDNRRKLVHLTDAGRETALRGRQILTEPPPSLTALPAEQLEALDQTLTSLAADSMQPRAEQASTPTTTRGATT
jgi:DNA-binding MarR family transcriptional regulator